MKITRAEQRETEIVYWIDPEDGTREFGIVFPGGPNVANDEVVAGVLLGEGLLAEVVRELEPGGDS